MEIHPYPGRWVFGCKLHPISITGYLIIPLTADVTTANVQDNQKYISLTTITPSSVFYMTADHRYDDKKLYDYSKKTLRIDLICPVDRCNSSSMKRLERACFYESSLGQVIHNRRRISIEPLIEHIKSVFRIDPLPSRGFHTVYAIVLLFVLLYQIMVYYNCKTDIINPKSIKYMLGTS
jgi:hypothetical protein